LSGDKEKPLSAERSFGGFFVPFQVVMTGQIYNFGRINLQKRTNRKKVRTSFQNLPMRLIRALWNLDFFVIL